jgi:hypothetical protein
MLTALHAALAQARELAGAARYKRSRQRWR